MRLELPCLHTILQFTDAGYHTGFHKFELLLPLTFAHIFPQLICTLLRRSVVFDDAVAFMFDPFENQQVVDESFRRLLCDFLSGAARLTTSHQQPLESDLLIGFDIHNLIRSVSLVVLFEVRNAGRIDNVKIASRYLRHGCAILKTVVLGISDS